MRTLPAIDAYRQIASVYDDVNNPVTALERRVLSPLLPDVSGKFMLDVGAGTGYWSRYCQALGARTVAVDACSEMLARALAPRVAARAEALPLPANSADMVICGLMLSYAPEAFAELARVLRPGGMLFVTDVHPRAIANGWTRGFRVDGHVVQAAHHAYSVEDLAHPSLHLEQLVEAAFGEPEWPLFAQAGKQAAFEALAQHPAIFVAQWSKPC